MQNPAILVTFGQISCFSTHFFPENPHCGEGDGAEYSRDIHCYSGRPPVSHEGL